MPEVFTFLGYGLLGLGVAWIAVQLSRWLRAPGTPSPEPYECGEKPVGSPYAPFVWPYLRLIVLLLVLEAEVILILPWVWVQRSLPPALFWGEIVLLLLPIVGAYGYALRAGWLTFSPLVPKPSLPKPYRQWNASQALPAPESSSYSFRPASVAPLPSLYEPGARQTPSESAPRTPGG